MVFSVENSLTEEWSFQIYYSKKTNSCPKELTPNTLKKPSYSWDVDGMVPKNKTPASVKGSDAPTQETTTHTDAR